MRIYIDAGHGGRWPKGDPGVVSSDGSKLESGYTFLYSNVLCDYLSGRGFSVVKTRDQDLTKTPLNDRTRPTKSEDLFISLHFDALTGGKMIYYSTNPQSKKFATDMDSFFGSNKILPTSASRFGGLYIDDAHCPAILIEIARIEDAKDDKQTILAFCEMVEKGIKRFLGQELPFSRVFLVHPDATEELLVDKMSLVGDKLYIRTKQ